MSLKHTQTVLRNHEAVWRSLFLSLLHALTISTSLIRLYADYQTFFGFWLLIGPIRDKMN